MYICVDGDEAMASIYKHLHICTQASLAFTTCRTLVNLSYLPLASAHASTRSTRSSKGPSRLLGLRLQARPVAVKRRRRWMHRRRRRRWMYGRRRRQEGSRLVLNKPYSIYMTRIQTLLHPHDTLLHPHDSIHMTQIHIHLHADARGRTRMR